MEGVTKKLVEEFDLFLKERGLKFSGVAVGSTPLILLNIINRETGDCDVIEPLIPEDVKKAAEDFSKLKADHRYRLKENWFNNGPESIREQLPKEWREKLQVVYKGQALEIYTLDRINLLRTKLAALCDRGSDLEDVLAMKPTKKELDEAIDWVKQYDSNELWPTHVEQQIKKVKEKLGIDR
jgi:hypothetical protein